VLVKYQFSRSKYLMRFATYDDNLVKAIHLFAKRIN